MMKNKKIMSGLFAIVLATGIMCLLGANDEVVYAETADVVSAVTLEGVDYIVEKHTDIRDYRTDGYYTSPSIEKTDITSATNEWVFAGWYTNATCTDTLKKGTVSGEGYAKFVSADVLSVRCQISTDTQPESQSTLLRCISSVDTLKYSKVGFDLITPTETKYMESSTVGTRITVTEDKTSNPCNYSPKVVDTESEYFYSAVEAIQQEDFVNGFLVKPYWITKDGTKVYGVSKYVVINDALNKSAIYIPVKKSEAPTTGTTFTVNGSPAECKKYDADGGYAQLRCALDTSLGSVTKYTVTGGDEAETTVYYRNLNTKYTGDGTADQSWYTAYEGTTEDEFVIATNADLYGLSTITNTEDNSITFAGEKIYLCADIDLNQGKATRNEWDKTQTKEGISITDGTGSDHKWTPIGEKHWQNNPFAGVFDGQGHTISGLYLEKGGARIAMFARVTGEIRNFRMKNSYINQTTVAATSTYFTGSVAGRIDGTICDVYSEAIVKSKAGVTGGIVGTMYGTGAKLEECHFAGIVDTSGQMAGGLAGSVHTGDVQIKDSSSEGTIYSTQNYIGGIVGYITKGTVNITKSSSDSIIDSANQYIGGIVGYILEGTVNITGTQCGSTINSGNHYLGGLVGYINKGTVDIKESCFSGSLSGKNSVGGIVGAIYHATNAIDVTLSDCLNSGAITGISGVAGLCGRNYYSATSAGLKMERCLNIGLVRGQDRVGSVVGWVNTAPTSVGAVYATKTSTATGTSNNYNNHAYGTYATDTTDVTMYSLEELTVGGEVTADTVTTKLSGLFGVADTIWTIRTTEGSTPELDLTK